MGLRGLVPALHLRLGQNQQCYDFCKWWSTTARQDDYDFGDLHLGHLDLHNEDVFEDPAPFLHRYEPLSQQVAITLTKIRLVRNLEMLQHTSTTISTKDPQEILGNIRGSLVGDVIGKRKALMEKGDWADEIRSLNRQIDALYTAVNSTNKHFWPVLLEPGDCLTKKPEAYSSGSPEEAILCLKHNYAAWRETPGAIDVIKEKQAA